MKLKLSDTLSLPIDAVTQTFAFLGRRGSGKTYGSGKLAELFLEAGAQIVVLDPIGTWYGLRLSADGKSKGFSVPVFGGEHGDVPLEPQAGALIAKLLVDQHFSAVLDVSTFRKEQRKQFVTDFAEDLIKLGRNYGIGATLLSQRPQSVNKDVLNQTEVLLAFQMTGPQERKTIDGWISDKGIDEKLADILPRLKVGEARLWSPQWLGVSETIHIAKKKTFDASSTPTVGAAIVQPKELSPVDVEKIKTSMADVVKRAEDLDPKKLQARIRQLEIDLAKKPAAEIQTKVETQTIEVFPKGLDGKLGTRIGTIANAVAAIEKSCQDVRNLIDEALTVIIEAAKSEPKAMAAVANVSRVHTPSLPKPAPIIHKNITKPITAEIGDLKLNKKQQEILDAIAWWESIGITAPTGIQVGAVALVDPTGGHFSNLVSPLSSNGLIERANGKLTLTDLGRSIANVPETASTLVGYHDVLRNRVRKMKAAGGRTIDILDTIIAAGGKPITSEEIGQLVGIDHTGGHFSNTIGPLSTAGLITRANGVVTPTNVLFPEGLN
jgi:hypothetical protein